MTETRETKAREPTATTATTPTPTKPRGCPYKDCDSWRFTLLGTLDRGAKGVVAFWRCETCGEDFSKTTPAAAT